MNSEEIEITKYYSIENDNYETIKILLIDYNNHLLDFKTFLLEDKKNKKNKKVLAYCDLIDEKRKLIAEKISYLQSL